MPVQVSHLRFGFPTGSCPFYSATVDVVAEGPGPLKVTAAEVDGRRHRDFTVWCDGRESYDGTLQPGASGQVVIRADWVNGGQHTVRLHGTGPAGEAWSSDAVTGRAPGYGGYWARAWKHYASVVLTESAGLERRRQPVHVTLILYRDRLSRSEEIRVVGIDPVTGWGEEVPCQVLALETWDEPDLIQREPYRYQATVSCELVFLADVPAYGEKVYLVFYGNPDAPAAAYRTDLSVRGDGRHPASVENSYYRIDLHGPSGFIHAIHVKQGLDLTLDHGLEPPGTVHWNPDCYAPPKPWSHASDWNPPPQQAVTAGPLLVMTSAWGSLPFGVDEVEVSVRYEFYAHTPWVLVSTITRVVRPVAVQALRIGEMVFNKAVVDHFAWRNERGEIRFFNIHEARPHPRPAVVLPANTPWVAVFSPERRVGLAAITLDFVAERFGQGLPTADQAYMYVEVGPWVYWCRPLVNTFVSNNPTRMVRVPEGSLYIERNAYLPFRLDRAVPDGLEVVEAEYLKLASPLGVRLVLDTDPRVPEKWVPPILAQPFEELPPEQVFRAPGG